MLTKKRVLTGLVTATAAGILFTGAPAGAQPAPAGLTGAGVASARALQAAPATALTYDHHRRRHFRHRRYYRHHRPYRRHWRHWRHHRRHWRPFRRHYRHYRHGRYMGFSRMTVANRNANVNRNRVLTGVRVANQNNNIAIARNRGFRRWGG